MRHLARLFTFVVMPLALGSTAATAGPISLGAFGASAVTTTFDGLGLPFTNPPPLVIDGHTFDTSIQVITYFPEFAGTGCDVDCIATGIDVATIDIEIVALSLRAGLDVVSFQPGASGMAEFYDQTDTLLGSVAFSIGGSTRGFVGWETDADLISRISVAFTSENNFVEGIDNLIYEAAESVPAPGALTLLSLGLIGLGIRRQAA